VALSEIDRNLLQRCLTRKPRAWEDFVDRFLGLVVHVVNHTAQCRSIRLANEDREDLCAEVFLTILKNDFSVLRNFRGESSLATYLTVIARRVVVRELMKNVHASTLGQPTETIDQVADPSVPAEQIITDQDEIAHLLDGLNGQEAEVVRLFHLEKRSYQEISSHIGIPENSIGPLLSRALTKARRAGAGQ
jgi:RNA polymerase sigma-70 factor (ECF subfamily)